MAVDFQGGGLHFEFGMARPLDRSPVSLFFNTEFAALLGTQNPDR